ALPDVEAALAGAPEAVRQRFAETEEALRDAASAARAMVDRITRFCNGEAAPLPATAEVTSLDRVVEATVAIVDVEVKKRATLVLDLEAKLRVAVDPTRASQIVLGLVMSA